MLTKANLNKKLFGDYLGEFTHPLYACVYRIALHFYYLPWFVDVYEKKVITWKTQRNAENAWGNQMWQLGFRQITSIT